MSRGNSNKLLNDAISIQKTMIKNLATCFFWLQYAAISIVVTLLVNLTIIFILSKFTTLKINLSYSDGLGTYLAFCIGLSYIDIVIGLITLVIPHNVIFSNTKLFKFVHIIIYIVCFVTIILCSLNSGNKAYNNYQNYKQTTNYILKKYGYELDLDENSIIFKDGFVYKKEDSEGHANVYIDFDYSSDSIIVKKISMYFDLTEDDSLTKITKICNLANQLYPNETLESLNLQILELIQRYKITGEEQYNSYLDSNTQFSISVNKTEYENCDYSLVIRIAYFGDGT